MVETEEKPASPQIIDFTTAPDIRPKRSGKRQDVHVSIKYPVSVDGKSLNPKQIRSRARRAAKHGRELTREEMAVINHKPIDEWDDEEIARGKPRNPKTGRFMSGVPKWLKSSIQEEAKDRFHRLVRENMNATTIDALHLINAMINNDEVDDRGRPVVPASTKLDASKFLIEHVVGKPTQRIENDVSVKLQSILAQVMVNPGDALRSEEVGGQGYTVGHLPGVTMPMGQADEDIIDAEFEDG